jgi:hypothetical protein
MIKDSFSHYGLVNNLIQSKFNNIICLAVREAPFHDYPYEDVRAAANKLGIMFLDEETHIIEFDNKWDMILAYENIDRTLLESYGFVNGECIVS